MFIQILAIIGWFVLGGVTLGLGGYLLAVTISVGVKWGLIDFFAGEKNG